MAITFNVLCDHLISFFVSHASPRDGGQLIFTECIAIEKLGFYYLLSIFAIGNYMEFFFLQCLILLPVYGWIEMGK